VKRVLVAPLDWGLGHATRCIPVIRELIAQKCDVVIAGSGASLELLRAEFPSLQNVTLPGYNPVYPTNGSMVWKMASQLFKFIHVIKQEHVAIEDIVKTYKIDYIISDNRYGCWSTQVPAVFITHQSNILMPKRFGWLQGVVRNANENQMKKFSSCWIPDDPNLLLSGDLTSFGTLSEKIDTKFIGLLTRFQRSASTQIMYDVAAIFSGPEPQRTILENIVLPQLQASCLRYFVVRGAPGAGEQESVHVRNYMTSADLQHLIQSSNVIIARSGYSTLMDMSCLAKKVIFVPTPGQTEQQYLAKKLMAKRIAYAVDQNNFDLDKALSEVQSFTGFPGIPSNQKLLKSAVEDLLKS
jgi:UDP-N-acetylglucosamine transferase subunit ALG13